MHHNILDLDLVVSGSCPGFGHLENIFKHLFLGFLFSIVFVFVLAIVVVAVALLAVGVLGLLAVFVLVLCALLVLCSFLFVQIALDVVCFVLLVLLFLQVVWFDYLPGSLNLPKFSIIIPKICFFTTFYVSSSFMV